MTDTSSSSEIEHSYIGEEVEGLLSCNVLTLTIDNDQLPSDDSFSSCPETKHNKGALEFIKLVEQAQQEREQASAALEFESLVIQMLDMKVGDKVATSTDIPAALSSRGWDQAQVSNVWRVAAGKDCSSVWNEHQMEQLGGKGILTRVWNELKAGQKTGYGKRMADLDIDEGVKKKIRSPQSSSSFTGNNLEVSKSCSNVIQSKELASMAFSEKRMPCPILSSPNVPAQDRAQDEKRRKRKPRRRRIVQASKITDWLTESPSQNTAPAAPEHLSQSPTVYDPAVPKPQDGRKEKTRRRRRKARRTNEEENIPSLPGAMISNSTVGEPPNGNLMVDDRSTQHNSAPEAESAAGIGLCGLGATSVSGSGLQEVVSNQGCADF